MLCALRASLRFAPGRASAALFADDTRLRDPRPARAHVLLGVAANAPLCDIKDAYWRLAKCTHPDNNQGDEEAAALFARLTRAYEAMIERTKSGDSSGFVEVVRFSEGHTSRRKVVSHAKAIFMDVAGDMAQMGSALSDEMDRLAADNAAKGRAPAAVKGAHGTTTGAAAIGSDDGTVLSSSGGPDWGGLWGMADMMAAEREQRAAKLSARKLKPAIPKRGGGGARSLCTVPVAVDSILHTVHFSLEQCVADGVGQQLLADTHVLLASLGEVLDLASPKGATPPMELSLTLCSDEYIAALNKEWRDVSSATDVLSFPMVQFSSSAPLLLPERPAHQDSTAVEFARELTEAVADGGGTFTVGELVISLDTAQMQAQEAVDAAASAASSVPLTLIEAERDVLRILLTHGMLHLLGFAHEDLASPASAGQNLSNAANMGRAEDAIMGFLGWKGQGLVFAHFDTEEMSTER